MPGYTKGAAAVLRALQGVEGDREAIWSNVLLLAILDLSPVESALAHALRLDSVWSRTMREQFRLAWSGSPEWRHLRATSMSGLSLSVLLERAEQVRQADGSEVIGERHLATVLAEMLRDNLRRDGVDTQRLVEEVAAMELSPQRERIEQALGLEELRFTKEQQTAHAAAEHEREQLRSNLNSRGILHSSLHVGGVIELHVRMMERLIQMRIDLRRDMARRVSALGSPSYLADLKKSVEDFIDATWLSLPSIIVGSYRGGESEDYFRQQVSTSQWADVPLRLKSNAEREIEALKHEVGLGMLKEEANLVDAPSQVRQAAVRRLGIEGLHPRIVDAASDLFTDGHYAEAIFEAFKSVENRVRSMTGIDSIGHDLMSRAFSGDPPAIQLTSLQGRTGQDEQEGLKLVFMGAMKGIRNPKAHEDIPQEDPQRTLEYLAFASLLMRRLDDAGSGRG